MADLFVSYSRKDKSLVERLADDFKNRGREAWVDWERIPPTAEWMREIYEAIAGADAFLFVISRDSIQSEICGKEIDHAVACHKRLLPVVAGDVPDDSVPDELARLNWIFLRPEDDFDAGVGSLVEAVDTDLEHVRAHTRLFVRATEWSEGGEERSLLLRGRELQEAEQWLERGAEIDPRPTQRHLQFIHGSRKAAIRRQWQVSGALGTGLIIAIALGAIAFVQYRAAEASRQAEQLQREIAESRAEIALSRQMAAEARVLLDQRPTQLETSALLSADAARRLLEQDVAMPDVNELLRTSLRLMPQQLAEFKPEGGHYKLAFLRDGRSVVTGGSKTQLWDVSTGEKRFALENDDGGEIVVSRDGRLLATDGWMAGVWDSATGRLVAELPVSDFVYGLDFSADGRWLAAGTHHAVTIFDPRTGRELASWPSTGTVSGLQFSGDGRWLVSSGEDARLWRTGTWREAYDISEVGSGMTRISPNSRWLAVSNDESTTVWDLRQGGPHVRLPSFGLLALEFHPSSSLLATRSARALQIWRVDNGQEVAAVRHDAIRNHAAFEFSPNGRSLATAGGDRTARLWDTRTGEEVARIVHENPTTFVRFSPGGDTLATAGWFGSVKFWHVDDNVGSGLANAGFRVVNIAYSPTGDRLALVGERGSRVCRLDQSVEACEVLTSDPAVDLDWASDAHSVAVARPDHRIDVYAAKDSDSAVSLDAGTVIRVNRTALFEGLGLSPGGDWLVSKHGLGRVSTLVLWDVSSGQGTALDHEGTVGTFAWHPDGDLLATSNGTVSAGLDFAFLNVWSARRREKLFRVADFPVAMLAFSPDGEALAAAGSQELRVLAASTGQERYRIGRQVSAMAFSPDGKYLAADNEILDARTGNNVAILPMDRPSGLEFSPNSRWLVARQAESWSLGASGTTTSVTLQIWDVERRWLADRIGHASNIVDFDFAPDSRQLATVHEDGAVRTWPMEVEADDLLRDVCARLTRNLTPDEWRLYVGDAEYRRTCENLSG